MVSDMNHLVPRLCHNGLLSGPAGKHSGDQADSLPTLLSAYQWGSLLDIDSES